MSDPCFEFLGIRLNLPINRIYDNKTGNHEDPNDYNQEYGAISEKDFVMEFVDSKTH